MKRKRQTEFELCNDVLFLIIQYVDLYTIYKSVRLVNKQYFEVCNYDQLWEKVVLKSLNSETNLFLHLFQEKIVYLDIKSMRFTRKNAFKISNLSKLQVLNLLNVYSNSYINDTFCNNLIHLPLKTLLLPSNDISDHGMVKISHLSALETFEMRNNNVISDTCLATCIQKYFFKLKNITFTNVNAVSTSSLCACNRKQLSLIHVSFCSHLSTESIDYFSQISNNILKYCVVYGLRISPQVLHNFKYSCPNLHTFALSYLTSLEIKNLNVSIVPNLRTLILIYCTEVNDAFFKNNNQLKNLILCRTKVKIRNKKDYIKVHNQLDKNNCQLHFIKDVVNMYNK